MSKRILCYFLLFGVILASCAQPSPQPSAQPSASSTSPPPSKESDIPPAKVTETASPVCTDNAAFVSDVTVPDYTNVDPGASFEKTWRIKNTGTCTWTDKYSLVYTQGEKMGAPASTPLSQTEPDETLDITVNLTAPAKDAMYRTDFEIHDPAGNAIAIDEDTLLWVIITVGEATAAETEASSSSNGPGLATTTCGFSLNPTKVSAVVTAINSYRARNGFAAYVVNEQLTKAAQAHSEDMACNNFFTHIGSNGSSPASRAADVGYAAVSITENVYGSFPPLSGEDVVSWWANDQSDPNHNTNLISTKYSQIGVGYAFADNFGYYVVVFGLPK